MLALLPCQQFHFPPHSLPCSTFGCKSPSSTKIQPVLLHGSLTFPNNPRLPQKAPAWLPRLFSIPGADVHQAEGCASWKCHRAPATRSCPRCSSLRCQRHHPDPKSFAPSDAAPCCSWWVGMDGWRGSRASGTAGSRSTHLSMAPHPRAAS